MFGFLDMMGTYESRKVDNFEDGYGLEVDTCSVTDGKQKYETAVKHPIYNGGQWVVVEAYDTKEESQTGHNKWVKIMTTELPEKLVDCSNSYVSDLCSMFDCDMEFESED